MNWIENMNRCTGPTAEQSAVSRALHAGYECGRCGANSRNCHFSHFATPAQAAAWETGKRLAEQEPTT